MTEPTYIFGRSDDLIEIRGRIQRETYANFDEPTYLEFSNGVVLEIYYTRDGYWDIDALAEEDRVEINPSLDDDEEPRKRSVASVSSPSLKEDELPDAYRDYSDLAMFTEHVEITDKE